MDISRANLCRTAGSLGFRVRTAVKARRDIVLLVEPDHRAIESSPPAKLFLQSLAVEAVERRLAYYAEGATQNLQEGYFYGLEDPHIFGLVNAVDAFMAARAHDGTKLEELWSGIRDLAECPGPLQDLIASGGLRWPARTGWGESLAFCRQMVGELLRIPSPFISPDNSAAIAGCLRSPDANYGFFHWQVTIGVRNSIFSGLIGRTLPALPRGIAAYVNIGEPNLTDLLAKLDGN